MTQLPSNARAAEMTSHAALQAAGASVRRVVLENGLRAVIRADASAPVAAVQIWVGTGSMHEDDYLGAGLCHYMEHMVFKGTPTRGPSEISRAIDAAGGNLNAYTAHDRTVFHCELPSANWAVGLDVLGDAVQHASFPAEEWEREKNVILREFAMGRDSPERELSHMLWDTAYLVHPFRVPVIGYEEAFRAIVREDLLAFFKRHYAPDNMIVSVVGDVDPDAVEARIREVFSAFPRRARKPVVVPSEPVQTAPREARKTGDYELTRAALAWHTVPLSHPDAPALDVLAAVFGQGRSAELERVLKEERRLVLEVQAWSFTPGDPGLFGVSVTCEPTREAEALAALDELVAGWATAPVPEEALARARRQTLVQALGELETMAGQASSYASGLYYAGDPRFSERYLARLQSVTADDVRQVAARYLRAENRTRVVLAPAAGETGLSTSAVAAPVAGIERLQLANGIPLVVRDDPRLPLVHAAVVFTGGLLAEPSSQAGVTRLMAELLTRGTPARDAAALAREVEEAGASVSPFAGRNSFGLQGSALAADAEQLFDWMSDCLLHPVFDATELEKQRAEVLAGLRAQRERPMQVASEALRGLLYPAHPYRFDPAGATDTVERLTREDVAAHHARLVRRGNCALAIFGDIRPEAARALAERFFANLPEGGSPVTHAEAAPPVLPARAELVEPREQAIVLAGYPAYSLRDPRSDAVSLLAQALSGMSSDLFLEIREKRGLVYFVGSSAMPALDPGFFAFYAGTHAGAVPEVEQLLAEAAQRVASEGLREDEFQRAQAQLVADAAMALQRNGDLALSCALHEVYGLGYRHALDLPDRLARMPREEILKVAQELFQPGRCAVATVLPAGTAAGEPKETP